MARYLTINGRNICRRWLAEHPEAYPHIKRIVVERPKVRKPRPAYQRRKIYRPEIYARFFLPAISGEPAETRLIGIATMRDVEWVTFMSENYAVLDAGHTTFFPDHP